MILRIASSEFLIVAFEKAIGKINHVTENKQINKTEERNILSYHLGGKKFKA